jgi:hypothetical protein
MNAMEQQDAKRIEIQMDYIVSKLKVEFGWNGKRCLKFESDETHLFHK